MGLDIVYYSHAKPADKRCSTTRLFAHPFFPHACNLKSGYYAAEEVGSFHAGSYGGYGRFRALLCRALFDCEPTLVWKDPSAFRGKPFVELINFSDCEGAIAGPAATKLAEDFATHRAAFAKAAQKTGYPESFLAIYDNFAEAFKVASSTDGFVEWS